MPKARFSPELIRQLNSLVIAHNEAGHERVRLEDLKKQFRRGFERKGQTEMGMARVEQLLLAKSDQPRTPDGRFASGGSGQQAFYSDVKTPQQHQALREDNAGYGAANTAVIPETRFTQLGTPAAWAAGAALGAAGGFNARAPWKPQPRMRRPNTLDVSAFLLDAVTLGGARKVTAKIRRGADTLSRVANATLYAPAAAINELSDRRVKRLKQQGASKLRVGLAQTRGKIGATAAGAVLPGALLYAPVASSVAAWAGPSLDSWKGGRTVEKLAKVAAMPEALEALAKAGPAKTLMDQGRAIASRYIQSNRMGRFGQAAVRAGGVVGGAGAGAGAAYGGTALAERTYYREKDGKFTSKDRAVIAGAGAAIGALAGGAAGERYIRSKARQVASALMGRGDQGSDFLDTIRRDRLSEFVGSRFARADDKAAAAIVGAKPPADAAKDVVADYTKKMGAAARELADRRIVVTQGGTELPMEDVFSDQLRASFAARGLSGKTKADVYEAGKAAMELSRLAVSKSAIALRAKAVAEADEAMKPLRAAAAQGWEEWGRAKLREVERRQIDKLLRQTANPKQKSSWWFGVPDAGAKKKIFTDTWKATGNLDTALNAAQLPQNKADDIAGIRKSVKGSLDDFNDRARKVRGEEVGIEEEYDAAKIALTAVKQKASKAQERLDDLGKVDTANFSGDEANKHLAAIRRAQKAVTDIGDPDKGAAALRVREAKAKLDALNDIRGGTQGPVSDASVKRAGLSEIPRPRDPFPNAKSDGYLEGVPTEAALTNRRDRLAAIELTKINQRQIDAALKVGQEARALNDAVKAAAGELLNQPKGRVGRAIEDLSGRLAPHMVAVKRDLRMIGGDISSYVGQRIGNGPQAVGEAAQRIREKVTTWAIGVRSVGPDNVERRTGGAWDWLKNNRGKVLGVAAVAGGPLGVDYGADGKINFNIDRAKAALRDPSSIITSVQQNNGAYFRLVNPMADNQVTIMGVTQKLKDGRVVFLEGRVEKKDGTVIEIPALASVEDIEARYRSGGQQNNQNNQQGNRNSPPLVALGDEAQKNLNTALDRLKQHREAVETVTGANGESVLSVDFAKVKEADREPVKAAARAMRETLNDFVAKGTKDADSFYAALNTIVSGKARVLSAQDKLTYLTGDKSVWGDAAKEFGRPTDVAELRRKMDGLIAAAPAPANDGQASALRRAMVLIGHKGGKGTTIGEYGPLNEKIAARMGGSQNSQRQESGGRAEKAAGSDAPKPAAQRPRDTWDDDDWRQQTVDYAGRVLRNAIASRTTTGRPLDRETASLMQREGALETQFKQQYDAYLGTAGRDGNVGAEQRRRAAAEALDFLLVGLRDEDRPLPKTWREPITKAAPAPLRKNFDETKVRRHTKGNDQGGEFAPKGGARGPEGGGEAPPPRERRAPAAAGGEGRPPAPRPGREQQQPPEDKRSYFEPVRLGGTVGGALGGQAVWEVFNRYAPRKMKGGRVGRFAIGMLGSVMGGVAGQAVGESAAAEGYRRLGMTPPAPYERQPESGGDEAARAAGGILGSFLGAVPRATPAIGGLASRLPGGIALGTAGSLAGEELTSAAWKVANRHFGVTR